MRELISLPVDIHLEKVSKLILNSPYSLIKASTGSGKTTRVPPYLLKFTDKKILVLEPRKLAAKMLASRISEELNSPIGEEVGYLFKGERAISNKTRLLFITEGTLFRLIEKDPLLSDYEIVILDEFHERHKETDLAFYHLKKIMEKKQVMNQTMHVVFMSATLDSQFLKSKIPNISEYEVQIPPFPRHDYFLPNNPLVLKDTLNSKVKNILKDEIKKIRQQVKGILIFVPGKKEILELIDSIEHDSELSHLFELSPLHGDLSKDEQVHALTNSREKLKIVIATNIAESSITIPFINTVIDSGLVREFEGNVHTGFGKLVTKKIDQGSFEQRAGRSNRLSPGFVFCLYSRQDLESRSKFKTPELLRSPLFETTLSLLKFYSQIEKPYFLDSPSDYNLEMSYRNLSILGLINNERQLTQNVNSIDLSLDFRLQLIEMNIQSLTEIDYKEILFILNPFLDFESKKEFEKRLQKKILKKLSNQNLETSNILEIDEILLHGFLDLVGTISTNLKLILHNGENFSFHPSILDKARHLKKDNFVILLNTDQNELVTDFYVLEKKSLLKHQHVFHEVKTEEAISASKKKISTFTKFGLLTINEDVTYANQSDNDLNQNIKELIQNLILDFYQSHDFIRFKFYSHFFGKNSNTIQNYNTNLIAEVYQMEWMESKEISQFHKAEFLSELKNDILNHLNPEKSQDFDLLFPTSMKFSDRRQTPLLYEIHGENKYEVFVESFMQDFYGLKSSPQIAGGLISLTFKLLGPHKRALQVTKDLNSFWINSYPQMLKELSREYPRHHWPLDPKIAPPILLKRQLS